MTVLRIGSLFTTSLVLIAAPALGQQEREWTYSGVDRVEVDGVSGDVVVRPSESSGVRVRLQADVRPRDAFKWEVEERGSSVSLRERWGSGRSEGRVTWIIEVPRSTGPEIEMRSSSGDLELSGVVARVRFRSSSGDVRLEGATIRSGSKFDTSSGDFFLTDIEVGDDVELDTSSGDLDIIRVTAGRDFRFDTSSGDVLIEDSRGVLEGSSSSGDVRVRNSELDGPSRFESSSGNVFVHLPLLPSQGLEASSASGDVRLEIGDFSDDFTLELTKREDRGRIDVPFEISSEKYFFRYDQRYVEKTVKRGSGRPLVRLRTASGSIVVRELGQDRGE